MTIRAPIRIITAETIAMSVFMSPLINWSYQDSPASPSPPSDEPNEASDHGLTSSGSTASRWTSPSKPTIASQYVAALLTASPSISLSIITVVGSSMSPTRVASEVISNGSSEMNTKYDSTWGSLAASQRISTWSPEGFQFALIPVISARCRPGSSEFSSTRLIISACRLLSQ